MAFNRTLYTQLLNEKFKTNNFKEHLTTTVTSILDGKYTTKEIRAFEKELNEKDPKYNYKPIQELCTYQIQKNKNVPIRWTLVFEVERKDKKGKIKEKTIKSVLVKV